jgi:hypothetical protein
MHACIDSTWCHPCPQDLPVCCQQAANWLRRKDSCKHVVTVAAEHRALVTVTYLGGTIRYCPMR